MRFFFLKPYDLLFVQLKVKSFLLLKNSGGSFLKLTKVFMLRVVSLFSPPQEVVEVEHLSGVYTCRAQGTSQSLAFKLLKLHSLMWSFCIASRHIHLWYGGGKGRGRERGGGGGSSPSTRLKSRLWGCK